MNNIFVKFKTAVSLLSDELKGIRISRRYLNELLEELENASPDLANAVIKDAQTKALIDEIAYKNGDASYIMSEEISNLLFSDEEILSIKDDSDIFGFSTKDCFVTAVEGDSMIGSNINNGDTLLCKKQSNYESGDIVIVEVNGHIAVKRYIIYDNRKMLFPENPKYEPKIINITDDFKILGKVMNIIKLAK